MSVRSRLGLKGEEFSCPATFDPRGKGLAWAPPGLPAHKVGDRFSVRYRFNQPFVVSTNYRRVTAKFDDCREAIRSITSKRYDSKRNISNNETLLYDTRVWRCAFAFVYSDTHV